MSHAAALRQRLYDGGRAYGTMAFEFFTPGLIPLLQVAGCEFVILDTEHSGVGMDTIKTQIACARGLDIAVWVRVPEIRYSAIARVMDAGAQGIMVPMVETVAQTEELVRAARYRPEGERGCAFGMAHDDYRAGDPDDTMRQENARTTLIALIETQKGIENCEEIMRVPGLDVGWLGHFDLTNDMGITAQFEHPDFVAASERLARACAAAGKAAASADGNLDYLRQQIGRGYRLLGYSFDTVVMRSGYRDGIEALRAIT
jgi:2-keto-3-deoxy-L-rhamnonate aldolase RhmA